jgi:histidyl-tRNA synthetase
MDYTGRKLKGMLEQADRLRARYALILGDDELAAGTVQLRDMATKEQRTVATTDLPAVLRP